MAGEIALPASIYRISTLRFLRRLAEQGAIWALGCGLVLLNTPVTIVTGVVLLGVVYARNLEFVHECLHGTALPNARANRLIGQVLALPMLVSFERWRYEHAHHHHDVRMEGFRYEYDRLTNLREYVVHAFMLRHFSDAINCTLRSLRHVSGRLAARIRRDYCIIGGVVLLAITISIVLRTWVPLWLWFAPLSVASIIHTHIELPEHLGLTSESADAMRNSRIIQTNRFWEWFVNANNFHAVHHWNARIPMANVPAAHRLIASAAPTERYADFYRRFYQGLAKRC